MFADGRTEEAFRRDGYIVTPFLDEHQVRALTELHDTGLPEAPADFYATVFSRSADYRRRVSDGIRAVTSDKVAALFPHHQLCFALFVTKQPRSQRGRIPLHRDYSFVDAALHTAVHVWFPLVDVAESNACLHVVKGSHTLMPSPFAVNEYPSPFHPVLDVLERDFLTKVPMAAGSALAYDSRLLHGSGENLSEHPRPACVAILIPKGVTPRVYVWDGQHATRFDVLEVSPEFLLHMERGAAISKPYPAGVTYLTSLDYAVDPLQLADLARLPDRRRTPH